jgi:hypothetical protein
MSFAAADYFLAGRAIPSRPSPEVPPKRGEGLFDYLQKRQLASVGPGMTLAGTFGRWMSLPDDGLMGTRALSVDEVEDMAATIERGEPVVIGLVYNHHPGNQGARGPAGQPWQNHQVLAYGVVRPDAAHPSTTEFRIYDSNYPKADDAVIRCRAVVCGSVLAAPWGGWRVPLMGVECERQVGNKKPMPVRGVMGMPYAAKRPSEHLD